MSGKPVILCLGDSHTYGAFGGAWVRHLQATFPKLRFVNTGVNGTQTKNVHARLNKLIAGVRQNLVGVTLLIGTNDCMLSLACDAKDYLGEMNYRFMNGYSDPGNADVFERQYRALLQDLAGQLRDVAAAAARPVTLFIITLPPIGEVLADKPNNRVDEYNAIILNAAGELKDQQQALDATAGAGAAGCLKIQLIDLSARCKAKIQRSFGASTAPADSPPGTASSAAPSHGSDGPGCSKSPAPGQAGRGLPLPFWRAAVGMFVCAARRYIWGISYDRQSLLAGTVVLSPDAIHLNDTGAKLLEELLKPHLPTVLEQRGTGGGK